MFLASVRKEKKVKITVQVNVKKGYTYVTVEHEGIKYSVHGNEYEPAYKLVRLLTGTTTEENEVR